MTRRDLLRLMLAAPIAATLDVEKLLWIPGQMVTVPEMPIPFRMCIYGPGSTSRWYQLDAYTKMILGNIEIVNIFGEKI